MQSEKKGKIELCLFVITGCCKFWNWKFHKLWVLNRQKEKRISSRQSEFIGFQTKVIWDACLDIIWSEFLFSFKLVWSFSRWLQMNYYAWKMRAPRSHCFSPHVNNRHLWQLKKSKSWGPFWSYKLNSTANPAHLPQKLGQMGWIGSAV